MNIYERQRLSKAVFRAAVYAFITICALISVFPFIWMILNSFKSFGEINTTPPTFLPKEWIVSNYAEAWNKPESTFLVYYFNTIVISVFGVILQMLVCIPCAYALTNLEWKFRDALFLGILATMLIPGDLTIVPNFMIIRNMPLTGGNDIWGQGGRGLYDTYMGILLPGLASSFTIFLLRQAFMSVPKDYWQAAQIDGVGHIGYIGKILFWLVFPTIITAALLTFIGRWNSLQWPMLITSRESMRPLQVGLMYFRSEDGASPQLIMAAATFCVLPILFLYFLVQKQFTEAIVGSGIKG